MKTNDILRVTAHAPGTRSRREVLCIKEEIDNLVSYLSRRGYTSIQVWETITEPREVRGGEVW